jgi:hypothetical protein
MTISTVGDLLDALEDIGRSTPIRLAIQPSYPFEHVIGDLILVDNAAVYLSDGGQVDYLRADVRAELGW